MAPTTIGIVCALIAVHFAMREAAFERASFRKAEIRFPPVFSLRAMFWVGIPMFLFAGFKVSGGVRSSFDWVYAVICVSLALLAFFSVPGTIVLNEQGISIKRFLGLRVRWLNWENVASAVHSSAQKEIVVYAKDGTSISHTRFHVDASRFEAELRKRLGTRFIQQ